MSAIINLTSFDVTLPRTPNTSAAPLAREPHQPDSFLFS